MIGREVKKAPVNRLEQARGHKVAQEQQNNVHNQQQQQHEPAVKRVVFRLGATVMRQARLTQDTEQEEEEKLVMDFSEEEEEVRRR